MQYTVYQYKKNINSFMQKYPIASHIFNQLDEDCPFNQKQIENIFEDTDGINHCLYQSLSLRKGYKRIGNQHYLTNELTKEKISCTVENYRIIIHAQNKRNIFFDILYQISKRYVIIEEHS